MKEYLVNAVIELHRRKDHYIRYLGVIFWSMDHNYDAGAIIALRVIRLSSLLVTEYVPRRRV